MDEYKQGIDLQFMSNIDEIQQQLNELKTNIRLNFDSSGKSVSGDSSPFPEEISKFQKAVTVFKQSTNSINEFFGTQLPTSFEDAFKSALRGLGSLLKNAWNELDTMFSYNYLSDSDVRNLRLTWGLDAGEAYTYSTVADMMGIESLEDFAFMSDAELATFEKASNKIYEVWSEYGTDTELSDALMEFKVEMQVLKIEMLKPLMNVLTEERTKAAIKKFIDYLPDFLEALITIAEGLTNWLTGNGYAETEQNVYDALDEYDKAFTETYGDTLGTLFGPTEFEKNATSWWAARLENSSILDSLSSWLENKISGTWLGNFLQLDAENSAKSSLVSTTINNTVNLDGKTITKDTKEYLSSGNNTSFSNQTQSYKIGGSR